MVCGAFTLSFHLLSLRISIHTHIYIYTYIILASRKGQSSDVFVREAVKLMRERGYTIGNIDCTIIAQRPKLSPHKETIRDNLAEMLGLHKTCVNIKAKTHEKVDSLGENRSIAAEAVVLLLKAG
jgi:2-C-methyl-D-erythritol 2,4-cyclodiphosphate synthase